MMSMGSVWDGIAVFWEHNPQNHSKFMEYNP